LWDKKELSPLQKSADSTSLSDALLNNAQEDARALTSWAIPALPQDSDSVSLCPVRILSIYLTRTASLRSSTNKRLLSKLRRVSLI
jgi:hypothetical protein